MSTQPILPLRFLGLAPYADAKLVTTSVPIGTGATAVADTATTSVLLPKPPCTSSQLVAIGFSALIAAASSGGTVLAQVFKRNNAGTTADVTLTATKSIEADIITVLDAAYQIAITATSVQNVTFGVSDACRIDIVAGAALQTAPVLTFCGLWAIIKP